MTVPTDARAEMAAAIDYFEGRRMYRATRAMQRFFGWSQGFPAILMRG